MDLIMVTLRVIHILSGVFWAGTTFFLVGFLQPVIAQSGPEGGSFAQRLMSEKRFQSAMSVAAGLTILSGLVLYDQVSAGFQRTWVTSGTGLALALGGLAAVLAVVAGGLLQRPTATRLGALAGEIQRSGAAPTPAQRSEMQTLQQRVGRSSKWIVLLLALAVVSMAIARYIRF